MGDDRDIRASRHFLCDWCLLTVLVDCLGPETYTSHLPCEEMSPTLQDVAYLTSLPCACPPMTAHEVTSMWCMDILARFIGVLPYGDGFNSTHGPSLNWLCQFYVSSPYSTIHTSFSRRTY